MKRRARKKAEKRRLQNLLVLYTGAFYQLTCEGIRAIERNRLEQTKAEAEGRLYAVGQVSHTIPLS